MPLLKNFNCFPQFTGRRPDATAGALAGWPPPGSVAQVRPCPTPCPTPEDPGYLHPLTLLRLLCPSLCCGLSLESPLLLLSPPNQLKLYLIWGAFQMAAHRIGGLFSQLLSSGRRPRGCALNASSLPAWVSQGRCAEGCFVLGLP